MAEGSFDSKAVQEFISEAEELAEGVMANLLDLIEQSKTDQVDPDLINAIFRGLHTLKGISGTFGFTKLSKLSHVLEDLFDELRLGRIKITDKVCDIALEGIDIIKEMLGGSEEEISSLVDNFIERVNHLIHTGSKSEPSITSLGVPEEIANVLTAYEEARFRENISKGRNFFVIKASLLLENFDQSLKELQNKLKTYGEVITIIPSSSEGSHDHIDFDLILATEQSSDQLFEKLKDDVVSIKDLHLSKTQESVLEKTPLPDKKQKEEEQLSVRSIAKTVRVDIRKLDSIVNIVGELALSKIIIERVFNIIREREGYKDLVIEMERIVDSLGRNIQELQDSVMEVRMVPLSHLFEKLSKTVRRLQKDSKKIIDFQLYGGDTELDKLLMDEIADPLVHIIRNSFDHGIEDPEERIACGKPEKGVIKLNAFQKGNHVIIEVEDDGRGIDLEAIKKKGIMKKLIEDKPKFDEREIIELLFHPGFSTKEDATEISGRGVGLDVVRNNISKIGGVVEIESRKGKGTKVIITLPMTLAIIQVLVLEAGGKIFAQPISSVIECLRISPEDIKTVEKKEVIKFRDSTIPIIRISDYFSLPRSMGKARYYVIIIAIGDKKIGVLVDRIIGQRSIVVKPLGKSLRGMRGIAGIAESAQGKLILLLDMVSILVDVMKERMGSHNIKSG